MRLIKILLSTASATYKEWAAYRSHALVSLFVGPVMYFIQIAIWKAVYGSKGTLNGLTLNDMLVYFAAASLIYYVIMDFADWNLQMLIKTGKFLTFLLRPMSHRYYALSQKFGHRAMGIFVEFLPVERLKETKKSSVMPGTNGGAPADSVTASIRLMSLVYSSKKVTLPPLPP